MKTTKPKNICVSEHQWKKLSNKNREFLIQAERGGMRYLVENGNPYAWGSAVDGVFAIPVNIETDPIDAFIVTPK